MKDLRRLTVEEQRLCRFSGPGVYPVRLQQYLNHSEAFARATVFGSVSLSLTWTFRHCLWRFIRTFQPEKLLSDKDLWLCVERNGRFAVRQGKKGGQICQLSESDSYIFHFLCFLQIHRFWNTMRKRSRFPAPRLSVTVRDFSDRLDESVDYSALLHRAEEIVGQLWIVK